LALAFFALTPTTSSGVSVGEGEAESAGAGDVEVDPEGEGVVVARADAPPVARMAAVPRPMNTGLTADRQITAAAPPSRRR
jgi:hypothetical protein